LGIHAHPREKEYGMIFLTPKISIGFRAARTGEKKRPEAHHPALVQLPNGN